jgi:hypothetical protein
MRYRSGDNRLDIETRCDAYGENLVHATLLGFCWTYHHYAINIHLRKIARQFIGMANDTKIEDYFLRKQDENVISSTNSICQVILSGKV